jgi:hypothetical protein
MNHDSDTEMDILLRREARRNAKGLAAANPVASSASSAHAHLDADELSAYAEGALPERARQRYTAHIADCDACRKIVTEITLSSAAFASNVEAEEKPVAVQPIKEPRRSWREWLTSLFTPPVLGYAAPALALVAFAAIAIVVWTANRDNPSFVVGNNQPKQEQPSSNTDAKSANQQPEVATGTTSANSANPAAPLVSNSNAAASGRGVAPTEEQARPTTETTTAPSAGPSLDGLTTADAAKPKPAEDPRNLPPTVTARDAEAKQQAQPEQNASSANEVEDRSKEKDADALATQQRREAGAGETSGAAATSTSTSGRRNRGDERGGNSPYGASNAGLSSDSRKVEGAKSASAPAARARRDTPGDDKAESSTRMVAGKRFRQQNGVWVDTAYSSSRSTVKVKRGSEQYRALAADEPIIETVANSFNGAVIVVVRGRAYHIY